VTIRAQGVQGDFMFRSILGFVACLSLIAGVVTSASAQILPRPGRSTPTVFAPTSGRYRIVISGFAAAKETVDRDTDGRKDEVYAAAAFVLWDRRDGRMVSVPNVVWSREYGDIRGQTNGRIQAGSAGRGGGLWGGNGGDYAPASSDPRAPVGPPPVGDQLPLMVFEGGLSKGAEALLIAPSLWESDGRRLAFDNYATNWRAGGVSRLINSPAVQNQLSNPSVTSAVVPGDPTLQTIATVANIFTGGVVGSYLLGATTLITNQVDRPIGLTPYQNADQYQDRVVVVTWEKLQSLAVGAGISIAIPFAEPFDNQLNGIYTAYLRVERIQ